MQGWDQQQELPAGALAARHDGRVIAALADLFRRNSHDAAGHGALPGPRAPEELAAYALDRLLDPETSRLADVRGLRLHLSVPSESYPGPCVISVSAWDEDAGLWRQVGEVPLAQAGTGGAGARGGG